MSGELLCTVAPKIIESASTSTSPEVVIDNSLTLVCAVTGVPTPQVQWLVNGRPVAETRPSRLRPSGQELEIVGAQLTDAGRYTCIAKNDAGVTDRDFDLEVLGTYRPLDGSFFCETIHQVDRKTSSNYRNTT